MPRTLLAGYKIPPRVVLVERLPRLPNGKPDYPAVRTIVEQSAQEPAERCPPVS